MGPIGTACRAELYRIGHALLAANPREDFTALEWEIAEMDPPHAGWRAMGRRWLGTGSRSGRREHSAERRGQYPP